MLERYDYIAGVVENAFDMAVMEPRITSRERLVSQNSAPYAPRAPAHYEGSPLPQSNSNNNSSKSNSSECSGGGTGAIGGDNIYLSVCMSDSATSGFCKYVLHDQSGALKATSDYSADGAPVAVHTSDQLTIPDLDHRVTSNAVQSRCEERGHGSSAPIRQIAEAPLRTSHSTMSQEMTIKRSNVGGRSHPMGEADTMRKQMTRLYEELLRANTDMVYIGEDVQHGGYYLVTEGLEKSFPLRYDT